MAKIPDIPSVEDVPQDGPLAWLKNWLATLRLWVQLRDPRMTLVGDPLDKFTDRRELVDLGILRRGQDGTFSAGSGSGGSTTTIIIPGGGGSGGGDTPDLTPPPAPTGLAVDAGMFMVTLTWDVPTYTQGHGNANTIIYGAVWAPGTAEPTFGDVRTKRLAAAAGFSTIYSYPSEANTRWAFWISYLTVDGVEGPPGGGVHGVQATTAQDPSALLTVLTGQIRESHLYRALGDPIRSIIERSDAAAEDTVAALVAAHESGRRARTALLAEAAARGTAITEVRRVVAAGDAQLASQITTLTAAVDDNRTEALAAVETEAEARADGDGAEATQRNLLATQMRGAYTGTDLASVTSGLVFSERQARVTVDAAHASRLDSLEASVDDPGSGLLVRAAALEAVTTDSTTGNGALATRTSTLEARVTAPSAVPGNPAFNTTYAALVAEASARAQLDGSVQALYTMRAEVSAGGRTLIGGWGLSATSTAAAGPRIAIGFRADEFFVDAPAEPGQPSTRLIPFTIRTTTFTNGNVTMDPGVYIDAAYIINLTVLHARIATLVADQIVAASISVAQLVAGSLAVGAYAQSTGFVSGTSGWRISGNGNAEFSGVVVRGTIYAGAGSIGGNTIDATGVQSPGFTTGSAGWRLRSDGSVELNSATIRGGVYAGSLTAPTGTLGALQVVDGGHIRSGQTAWNTGDGFWIGSVGGVPKVSVGSAARGFDWDGANFNIRGDLIASNNLQLGAVNGVVNAQNVATLTLPGPAFLPPPGGTETVGTAVTTPTVTVPSNSSVIVGFFVDYTQTGTSGSRVWPRVVRTTSAGSTVVYTVRTPTTGTGAIGNQIPAGLIFVDEGASGDCTYSIEFLQQDNMNRVVVFKAELTVILFKRSA